MFLHISCELVALLYLYIIPCEASLPQVHRLQLVNRDTLLDCPVELLVEELDLGLQLSREPPLRLHQLLLLVVSIDKPISDGRESEGLPELLDRRVSILIGVVVDQAANLSLQGLEHAGELLHQFLLQTLCFQHEILSCQPDLGLEEKSSRDLLGAIEEVLLVERDPRSRHHLAHRAHVLLQHLDPLVQLLQCWKHPWFMRGSSTALVQLESVVPEPPEGRQRAVPSSVFSLLVARNRHLQLVHVSLHLLGETLEAHPVVLTCGPGLHKRVSSLRQEGLRLFQPALPPVSLSLLQRLAPELTAVPLVMLASDQQPAQLRQLLGIEIARRRHADPIV
mmetsp:Transcript_14453/g.49379  ORF Transcript_14453/g.49379 Transcript_14453/m.49379 type:complete len:336 (-) Transcript_14453:1614-2621(-)